MEVESGRPIAKAGIHAGDVVLSIGSRKIASEDDLREAIFKIGPGKTDYSYRRGAIPIGLPSIARLAKRSDRCSPDLNIPMKSSKQRRKEILQKRRTRPASALRDHTRVIEATPHNWVRVNAELLAPNNSYGAPDFVQRGYYVNRPVSMRGLRQRRGVDGNSAEVVV